MNLLPLFGLLVGFAVGDRRAFAVTILAAGIGLSLVAAFTDEIDGVGDPYVWVLTAVSLAATLLGVGIRHWFSARRATPRV